MRKKIIHIYQRAYDAYFPDRDSEYYYLAGWSSVIARYTAQYSNGYDIECWRPEREARTTITRRIRNVTCKLFPVRSSIFAHDWTSTMFRELRKESQKNKILIHHSGIHSSVLYRIAFRFRHLPIVAQHHGDLPPQYRYQRKQRLRALAAIHAEKKLLKNVDYFFVLRKEETESLLQYVPCSRISFLTVGVDFEKFKPTEKIEARKKLGIAQRKKVILYVGKFYKLKGVDIILEAYRELKQKYDIILLLVGGSPEHELYNDVKKSGALYYGRIRHDELPVFFSAADVYLLPVFSRSYHGFDVATIESLACGTPLVSTTLEQIPGDDRQHLGRIPRDVADVAQCAAEILDNRCQYALCREVASRYFDWKMIVRRIVNVYDSLFSRYYDE